LVTIYVIFSWSIENLLLTQFMFDN